MTSFWERVQALGPYQFLTKTGVPFHITEINENSVRIRVSSGRRPYLTKGEFDRAEQHRMVRSTVTPVEIRKEGVLEGNPAYITGIIREVIR
jgi:hypothetical protein